MKPRQSFLLLLVLVLIVVNVVLLVLLFMGQSKELTVSFLDVGQGDAIFIQSPTGAQMLIDGGPDRSILRELPKQMGLFDRSIDVVVATHPDRDHIGGLSDVFLRYEVAKFIEPGVANDTAAADALAEAVLQEGSHTTIARSGMRLHLGGGVYVTIVHPKAVLEGETNDSSIVMHLVYGETEFMFTGDISSSVEDALVQKYGELLSSDVLKAAHHGSNYSSSAAFLMAVAPSLVIVSVGENSYGHPTPEALARIKATGAKVVTTQEEGTIVLLSDGTVVREK